MVTSGLREQTTDSRGLVDGKEAAASGRVRRGMMLVASEED